MTRSLIHVIILITSLSLTACSSISPMFNINSDKGTKNTTRPFNANESMNSVTVNVAANEEVGGNLGSSMDKPNKQKLSRALDNPVGKTTTWTNEITGTTYSVTPTKKIVLKDNPFCRQYTLVVKRQNQERHATGTACVGADANWHSVGNM